MSRYRISEQAISDLDEIWFYTLEQWSLLQADRYYNQILDEIEFATNNFENGKSIFQIREGYKSSKVNAHFIFYKMGRDGVIEIVRVLHERMDIKTRLEE